MEYPTTREEAKKTNSKYYFTGQPCKHGHIALRKTKGSCVDCLKVEWAKGNETRAEYFKQYNQSDAGQKAKKEYYERNKEQVIEKIKDFKNMLSQQDSWTKGSPKSVNNLTMYGEKEANSSTGKANMPGHVRGALNWNYLRRVNGDNYSMKIVDGMKVVVCKLRNNPLNFTSIAYPVDELRLPKWFIELPFDDLEMENTLVDKKIDNLLGVLNWDLKSSTDTNSTFDTLFSFG